jgi:hypothetical protein
MSLAELKQAPERGLTLAVGAPGAGESTFCQRVILNSVVEDKPVLFVTTERSAPGVLPLLSDQGFGEPTLGAVSCLDVGLSTDEALARSPHPMGYRNGERITTGETKRIAENGESSPTMLLHYRLSQRPPLDGQEPKCQRHEMHWPRGPLL